MLTSAMILLLQAFVVIAAPVALLRLSGLRGVVPLVVVQILLGIALGPSGLGRVAPHLFQIFAGPAVLPPLSGLASIAVLIFGLTTGLHLDADVCRCNGGVFWSVAAGSVVVPGILGCAAAYWILARYPDELLPGVTPVEFMAAIGLCVAMKALPVLGAILGEMGLLGERVANLALGVAGLNDIMLWGLLGVLLTASASTPGSTRAAISPICLAGLLPAYLLVMVFVVRPLLGRLAATWIPDQPISAQSLVIVCAATIASALATETMGLHYIVGTFLMGVVAPTELRRPVLDRLHVVTVVLLMPFFFTLTGLRTSIDPNSPEYLQIFIATSLAAFVGIAGGTTAAARFFGESWSFAFGLGSLLQAKGLTELIVLTVLLDAKIISTRVFSAMILMALVTTASAMPLARFSLSRSRQETLDDSSAVVSWRL